MLLTKLLVVVASLATADVVRNAAELRAALADGAPTIGLLMRRNSSRGLKRSGSTLQRSGSATSKPDEENVQAPVGRRPALNRSATWRTSAPSVEM